MDAIGTIQHDLPALIVGIALCTMAIGICAFALLGREILNIDLPVAGVFALLYGIRLLLTTASAKLLLNDPRWLPYGRAMLEYLVPISGAWVLERFFGKWMQPVNRLMVLAFAAVAMIGIPYELVTHRPGAFGPLDNAVVDVFLVVYLINIFMPAPAESHDWKILRIATAIFAVYVINAHLQIVHDPYGLTSEPIGLLIFTVTIVAMLIRHSLRTQIRVAAVDGELAAARQIQMSILPKSPPAVPGLDLTAIYAPASEVAGDFYEFLPLDDRSLGILVADVSGHGVPAALVASMLKVAVAGHADLAREPARLFQEMNAFFCGKLERQFITACYALIDDGRVTIASAGHPPPLVVRGNGAVEEIAAEGALIGRFRGARFSEQTATFGSGDALVLYTDGVVEALNGGEMWGEKRFHDALAGGAMPQQILDAVKSWSPTLHDDVTLVVAKRV